LREATSEERAEVSRENTTTGAGARVHVTAIVDEAINTLSQAGDDYLDCLPDIIGKFRTAGGASGGLPSKRFSQLICHFVEGSPPREAIMDIWKELRRNRGNSNASNTAQEEVDENCRAFVQVMNMGTGKKNLFWLPDGEDPVADDFPSVLKVNPDIPFAPFYPAFPIKFDCVKTRLNTAPKRNTDANKAIRWEDIDDGVIKTKRKIASVKKKTHRGGANPAARIKHKGFIYRLCYLEVDSIVDSSNAS